jgi:hypothetical protein
MLHLATRLIASHTARRHREVLAGVRALPWISRWLEGMPLVLACRHSLTTRTCLSALSELPS